MKASISYVWFIQSKVMYSATYMWLQWCFQSELIISATSIFAPQLTHSAGINVFSFLNNSIFNNLLHGNITLTGHRFAFILRYKFATRQETCQQLYTNTGSGSRILVLGILFLKLILFYGFWAKTSLFLHTTKPEICLHFIDEIIFDKIV